MACVTLPFELFNQEMVCYTSYLHGLYFCYICREISNDLYDLDFNLLTCNWCMTHDSCMGCICATYEVNPSNRHEAMEQTWQKLQTICVTLTLDFFTCKYTYHKHFISEMPGGSFMKIQWQKHVLKKALTDRQDTYTEPVIELFAATKTIFSFQDCSNIIQLWCLISLCICMSWWLQKI